MYKICFWNSQTLRFRQVISFNHFPWFDCDNLDYRLLCTKYLAFKTFLFRNFSVSSQRNKRLVFLFYSKSNRKCCETRQLQHLKKGINFTSNKNSNLYILMKFLFSSILICNRFYLFSFIPIFFI